jgi:hypothetical protein
VDDVEATARDKTRRKGVLANAEDLPAAAAAADVDRSTESDGSIGWRSDWNDWDDCSAPVRNDAACLLKNDILNPLYRYLRREYVWFSLIFRLDNECNQHHHHSWSSPASLLRLSSA